jgi:hypothetical protein
MGKLKPKKYGDRQIVDVGNKEGETLKTEVSVVPPDVLQELTALILKEPAGK